MHKPLARWMLPILLFVVAGCGNDDAKTVAQLKAEMGEVKTSAEAVLTTKQPKARPDLAALARQIAAADQLLDAAQRTATSLTDAPTLKAAALDYLKTVRGAVDQTSDRHSAAIDRADAIAQDSTVSAAIGGAQDEAALERASADANAKASALAAAVSHEGNAVIERERRLEAVLTALQHNAQPLAGYPLVSHEALDAAMAGNVTSDRSVPVRISIDDAEPAHH